MSWSHAIALRDDGFIPADDFICLSSSIGSSKSQEILNFMFRLQQETSMIVILSRQQVITLGVDFVCALMAAHSWQACAGDGLSQLWFLTAHCGCFYHEEDAGSDRTLNALEDTSCTAIALLHDAQYEGPASSMSVPSPDQQINTLIPMIVADLCSFTFSICYASICHTCICCAS